MKTNNVGMLELTPENWSHLFEGNTFVTFL